MLEMLEIESADLDLVILNSTRRAERKNASASALKGLCHEKNPGRALLACVPTKAQVTRTVTPNQATSWEMQTTHGCSRHSCAMRDQGKTALLLKGGFSCGTGSGDAFPLQVLDSDLETSAWRCLCQRSPRGQVRRRRRRRKA